MGVRKGAHLLPFSTLGQERDVPAYPSKERVERDGVLVYAEGDPIPDDDTEELRKQGYLQSKPRKAPADKAVKPASNKARKR